VVFVPNLDFRPVPRELYRSFTGPDPWDSGHPTTWLLKGYQMKTSTVTPPYPPGRVSTQAVFVGIESEDHGRYRILPMALQDLWHEGRLRGPELPALLHLTEDCLTIGDYPPPFRDLCLRMLSITLAVLAFLTAGVAIWTRISVPFYFIEVFYAGVLPMVVAMLLPLGMLVHHRIRRRRLRSRYRDLIAGRTNSPVS
jgi:hypothetical protein